MISWFRNGFSISRINCLAEDYGGFSSKLPNWELNWFYWDTFPVLRLLSAFTDSSMNFFVFTS